MRRFLLAVACVLALTGRASAGSFYSYTTIVDTHTNRPDGKGKFDPSDFVAIDGPWVVFRDQPNTPNDSFWSANLLTHKLTKLVDFTTPVPGGSGAFVGFQTCQAAGEDFRLHGTTLLFFGVDASAPHCSGGVYAQSVLGGKPVKIVDYRSTFPDRGTFWQLDETFKVDDLDSSVAAVAAQLTGGPGAGVYATTPSGKLKRIAGDGLTIIHPTWPWPVEVYHCASVGGGDVAFVGDDTFDPVAGFNAIYAEAEAGGPISELVRSDAALPGDANPHFHGRFKCPMTDGHVVY
jgi:hypothetical protein